MQLYVKRYNRQFHSIILCKTRTVPVGKLPCRKELTRCSLLSKIHSEGFND